MAAIISVVSKYVSEHERPNIHGVRYLITSTISSVRKIFIDPGDPGDPKSGFYTCPTL